MQSGLWVMLQGRATVEMNIKLKEARSDGVTGGQLKIVADGYNAPVTAGNFIDLVQRGFYNNMEIQRADGFVVQTGDPGPEQVRCILSTQSLALVDLPPLIRKRCYCLCPDGLLDIVPNTLASVYSKITCHVLLAVRIMFPVMLESRPERFACLHRTTASRRATRCGGSPSR